METSAFCVDILTTRQLLASQEPPWLIDGFIHETEIGAFWGAPGTGKSFVALDWALSVATGQPWLGRYPVIQGPVLYMCGEGAPSLAKRIDGWMAAHGVKDTVSNAYFITRALPLREEEAIKAVQDALETFLDIDLFDPLQIVQMNLTTRASPPR